MAREEEVRWTTVAELIAGFRECSADAFRAITALGKVSEMRHLSTDIYQDLQTVIETLYVRAGHAEGEVFGIENYLAPIVKPLQALLEDAYEKRARRDDDHSKDLLQSTEPEAYMEGFTSGEVQGVLIGVSLALSIVEEATGVRLWEAHDYQPDREEVSTYF